MNSVSESPFEVIYLGLHLGRELRVVQPIVCLLKRFDQNCPSEIVHFDFANLAHMFNKIRLPSIVAPQCT